MWDDSNMQININAHWSVKLWPIKFFSSYWLQTNIPIFLPWLEFSPGQERTQPPHYEDDTYLYVETNLQVCTSLKNISKGVTFTVRTTSKGLKTTFAGLTKTSTGVKTTSTRVKTTSTSLKTTSTGVKKTSTCMKTTSTRVKTTSTGCPPTRPLAHGTRWGPSWGCSVSSGCPSSPAGRGWTYGQC